MVRLKHHRLQPSSSSFSHRPAPSLWLSMLWRCARPSWCAVVPALTVTLLFITFTLFDGHEKLLSTVTSASDSTSVFSCGELEFLRSFDDLLYLEGISEDGTEYVFASRDHSAPTDWGRLRVYRITDSSSRDYVRFEASGVPVRAVHGLQTINTTIGGLSTSVPSNSGKFERKWRNGQMLECLGLNVSDASVRQEIKETFVEKMAIFRDFVELYDSTPFLFGGSLLGWYRECAFIRDTLDVDFCMKIGELNESMLTDMQHTKAFKLFWILGMVNDSLEISVMADKVKIDLFFMFQEKEHDWAGGMMVGKKQKMQWFYPHVTELCVGDLYGKLFNVPCNVEDVLEADYGKNWTIPAPTKTFVWYSSHKNVHRNGFWTKEQWSQVYRVFS